MKAAWQPTLKFIRLLDISAATVALRFEFPLFTFFERGFSLLFLQRNIVRVCKICRHFFFCPAVATGLNKVVSDVIKSIRCCLIESCGGVGGEVGDSFTRKKKKNKKNNDTWRSRPEEGTDICGEMFWDSMLLLPRRMLLYKTVDE